MYQKPPDTVGEIKRAPQRAELCALETVQNLDFLPVVKGLMGGRERGCLVGWTEPSRAWFKKCHFQVTPETDRALMVKGFLVLGVTLT